MIRQGYILRHLIPITNSEETKQQLLVSLKCNFFLQTRGVCSKTLCLCPSVRFSNTFSCLELLVKGEIFSFSTSTEFWGRGKCHNCFNPSENVKSFGSKCIGLMCVWNFRGEIMARKSLSIGIPTAFKAGQ